MTQPSTIRLALSLITLIICVNLQTCTSHPLIQSCSCYHYIYITRSSMLISSPVNLTPCASTIHPLDREINSRYSMKSPLYHASLQRPPTTQRKSDQPKTFNLASQQHNTQHTRQQQDQHHQVRPLTPQKCWLIRRRHRSLAGAPKCDATYQKKQRPSPTLLDGGAMAPGSRHEALEKTRTHKLRSEQLNPKWTSEACTHSPDYTNAPKTTKEEQQQSTTKKKKKKTVKYQLHRPNQHNNSHKHTACKRWPPPLEP